MRAMKVGFTIVLTAALGVAGCSTNPITGRSQLVGLVSDSEAIQGSAAAYQQMMADLDKKQKLEKSGEKDSPRAQQIQRITGAESFTPNSKSKMSGLIFI